MASELEVGKVKSVSGTQTAELSGGELTLKRGSSTPTYINFPDSGASLQLRGPSYATALTIASNGAATFQKSDGAIVSLYRNDSEITDGNTFGRLQALSGDSNHTAGTEVGSINFKAYGNQTGTRPRGQIRFEVANNASQAEAMRIEPDKKVKFYGGIAFDQTNTSATGAATDTNGTILEHYEEGTFTYTITGSSVAGTHSGILRQGNYTRVGNICTVMGYYYGTSGTGSGDMVIGGLPFPVKTGASPVGTIQANSGLVITAGTNPTVISAGSSTFKVRCTKEDGSAFHYAAYPTDPTYIRFGVTYVI